MYSQSYLQHLNPDDKHVRHVLETPCEINKMTLTGFYNPTDKNNHCRHALANKNLFIVCARQAATSYSDVVFLLFFYQYRQRLKPIVHPLYSPHRCSFASTQSVSPLSKTNPHTHFHKNPLMTPQVCSLLLHHHVLSHVCLMWQTGIKWALIRTWGQVCLCFAPLVISARALWALQRDDKLKRAIQSR